MFVIKCSIMKGKSMMIKKFTHFLTIILVCCLIVIGCSGDTGPNDISPLYPQLANLGTEALKIADPVKGEEIAVINTSLGTVKVRLFPENAPLAVENFITHAKDGYYDGVIFHRVVEDFVIQGGDPTGSGMGGESIYGNVFENEVSVNLHHFTGSLAMANAGPDTNGSQFYIVQGTVGEFIDIMRDPEYSEYISNYIPNFSSETFPDDVLNAYSKLGGHPELDYGYTVFGQVFEGMDVVNKIAAVEKDGERPVKDVTIKSVKITNY